MTMKIVEVSTIPIEGRVQPVYATSVIEAFKAATEMEKLCKECDGIGLAATQVGLPLKLFVVALKGSFRYCVNCTYEPMPEATRTTAVEGCLSLPGRFFTVERWSEVQVKGQEIVIEDGTPTLATLEMVTDFIAFQHEIDHQKGILISDCGREVFLRPFKS